MRFVVPSSDAGLLHQSTHGTAVVGAKAQKRCDQIRVTSNKTTAQARHIAALGQTGEAQKLFEISATLQHRGLQTTQRCRFAEIYFAVALV